MGLTESHSSHPNTAIYNNQSVSNSSVNVSQPVMVGSQTLPLSSPQFGAVNAPSSGLKSIGPDSRVGGGGGGDTFTVVHITPFELQAAALTGGSGVITALGAICATSFSGVGTIACLAGVGAAAGLTGALISHGEFPTLYIWWNDATWSYAGTNVVW